MASHFENGQNDGELFKMQLSPIMFSVPFLFKFTLIFSYAGLVE